MKTFDSPMVQQAYERLKELSADPEVRRLAFMREQVLREQENDFNAALAQGIEKGMRQGEAAILERQLSKRFGPLSEETRTRLKYAPLDQLDLWADRILDAPTLAEVFDGH